MKITTSKYELVHSGTIIQIEEGPINLVLPDKVEGDYTIIFEFLNVPNEKTVTKMIQVDKFNLKIQFINFNDKQNIGITEPMYLGTLEQRNLYLIYRVNDLVSKSKMINYCFYVERRETNG